MHDPGSRTWLALNVEYDGSEFHGWQIQPDVRTVQGEMEAALERMVHERIRIQGAGRTDAGVHALGQVASLNLRWDRDLRDLARGIDALTGPDVSVTAVRPVEPGFCARHCATGKLYRYRILSRPAPSPTRRGQVLHVRAPLDTDAMRRAARLLVGTRDFSSFRAADDEREDPRVTLQRCDVVECGDEVHVEVRAPGFLKYMVRTIVGTLLAVGRAKIPAGDVERIVEARDRSAAGPTAPARGLVLVEVFYDGSRPPRPPPAASATTSSGP